MKLEGVPGSNPGSSIRFCCRGGNQGVGWCGTRGAAGTVGWWVGGTSRKGWCGRESRCKGANDEVCYGLVWWIGWGGIFGGWGGVC